MQAPREHSTAGDPATELVDLAAGLGIVGLPLFPLALPAVMLVAAPLAVLAAVVLLLASPFALTFWLVARVLQARRRPRAAGTRGLAVPAH